MKVIFGIFVVSECVCVCFLVVGHALQSMIIIFFVLIVNERSSLVCDGDGDANTKTHEIKNKL